MKLVVVCSLAVLFLVFSGDQVEKTEAVNCNIAELAPCKDAVATGSPPTPECCEKSKEQQPCYCQYIKDPTLGKYFQNPNAKKAALACGVQWPSC